MPRHHRSASGPHQHYDHTLSSVMAASSMYAQQPQRIQMPSSYYTIPSGPDSASLQVPAALQTSFDAYAAETPAMPVILPRRASSGAWTTHDDHQLVTARTQGMNWSQIKDAYFPSKSANACRKRHERLVERKGAEDWDTRKLQQLAKEYMGMRKEIWSSLAARTGEKWTIVEAKCMANGLKNLQSAARAASRRDRVERSSHMTGYDDDSGISGIALTPVDELDASYSSPDTGYSAAMAQPSSLTPSSASVPGAGHHHQLRDPAATTHAAYLHRSHRRPTGSSDHSSYALGAYASSYGSQHQHQHQHRGNSSSISSMASMRTGCHHYPREGSSSSSSPFMGGQRMPNADMGIENLVNRATGGGA